MKANGSFNAMKSAAGRASQLTSMQPRGVHERRVGAHDGRAGALTLTSIIGETAPAADLFKKRT